MSLLVEHDVVACLDCQAHMPLVLRSPAATVAAMRSFFIEHADCLTRINRRAYAALAPAMSEADR